MCEVIRIHHGFPRLFVPLNNVRHGKNIHGVLSREIPQRSSDKKTVRKKAQFLTVT
jgi:hypothetical protein